MTLAFLPPFARVALNASAFTLLTFYLCVASSAAAQTLPDVPRPQTGGEWAQVFAPVSESFASIAPSPFLEPAEIQREGEWTFIEASLLEALKSGEPPAFQSIQLSGEMTTRQKTALTRLATPYQGKPLALQDYHALAKAVQEDCERRGRLCKLSFSAEGQALTLAVAPITLEAVTVENSRYFRARAIRYQLGMRPGDALNLNKLERRMRLIQDNPDIRLKAELKPGKELETVTLTLKADNTLPVHAVAYWNNMDQYYYGSHQWLTSITTGLNNTLGLNDTTLVSVIPGGRTPGVFLQYQVPLNAHGTRLIANWSRMNADPGGKDYEAFRLTGRAWALSLGVSQPLYVGETSRLSADLNFDVQQFRTNFKKHNPIEKEQLRILRAGLQFDHATEKQELSVRNQVEVGLDVMGGTPSTFADVGNLGGGSQFFKYLGAFYYLRNLPHGMAAVLNGTVQWSPDTLPSPQVGAIGGAYAGRGYREALIAADTFGFVSGELRFPCPLIPRKWRLPKSDGPLRDKVQLLRFVDYGYAKINDRALAPDPTNYLVSVGAGIRAELTQYLSGRLDLGIPLAKQESSHFSPRIHFGLEFRPL